MRGAADVKLLLVDDSPIALMMARMVLQKAGFQLVFAQSGEECLVVSERERPDLIVLDVVMPGMDGTETLRRLRARTSTRNTPVVMLTGLGDASQVDRCYDAGCNGYVTKPVDVDELKLKIDRLLGLHTSLVP